MRSAVEQIDGDWSAFEREVERHDLTILANDALRAAGVEPPETLSNKSKEQKLRALSLTREAMRLIDALAKAGINAIILKGPLLSQQIYGNPALRNSIDIDLLVDWDDFRAAQRCLQQSGYELYSAEPPYDDWRIEPWRELAKDIIMTNSEQRLVLELHHRLKSPAALLRGLTMAQAQGTTVLAGKEFASFERADLFIYLCVHAATSLWDRLKWLADLRALLAGVGLDEIEAIQKRSEHLGTHRCTALGLLLLHRIWGQSIPGQIAEMAQHDARLRSLEAASWQRLRGPERSHASLANSLARRHLMHLRDDHAFRRAYAKELTQDRELLERFALPKALRWLYPFLRVVLFVERKLGLVRKTSRG
ncbi:MAG: nucleotidyltransferase family protein [Pseudomonadota bacterium]